MSTGHTCPCGGPAWTVAELVDAFDRQTDGGDWPGTREEHRAMWLSLIGENGFYCSDEDDVPHPSEVRERE